MPDFTNLDPSLVASFWIYFIGSFVVGIVVGVIVAKLFFHRQRALIELERKSYLDKIKSLEEREKLLTEKEEELKQLKSEISNNALYWNTKQHEKKVAPSNKALFDMLHSSSDGKEE